MPPPSPARCLLCCAVMLYAIRIKISGLMYPLLYAMCVSNFFLAGRGVREVRLFPSASATTAVAACDNLTARFRSFSLTRTHDRTPRHVLTAQVRESNIARRFLSLPTALPFVFFPVFFPFGSRVHVRARQRARLLHLFFFCFVKVLPGLQVQRGAGTRRSDGQD